MAESFSYSEAHTTDKDKVRAIIPDKGTGGQTFLISDEQITLVLSLQSDIRLAAADCCDIIVGSRAPHIQDKTISVAGSISTSRDRSAEFFQKRAKVLRDSVQGGEPFLSIDNYSYSYGSYGEDFTEYIGED